MRYTVVHQHAFVSLSFSRAMLRSAELTEAEERDWRVWLKLVEVAGQGFLDTTITL